MITARERLKLLAGSLAAAVLPEGAARAAIPDEKPRAFGDPAGDGWNELVATLADAGRFVQSHPFYGMPEYRALAYTMIVSNLLQDLEMNFVFDEDFPYFSPHDNRTRAGIDNPDQRYSICKVKGGADYRIWGHVGSATRIEFQTYAGDPFTAGGGGVPSALMFEEVAVADDGSFEVFLTPEKTGETWMANPPDTTQLLIRATYGDWNDKLPAELHIDRIGMEGALRPLATEASAAEGLRRAARDLKVQTRAWPMLLQMRYGTMEKPAAIADLPMNVMAPIQDGTSRGAAKGRVMPMGLWDLEPEEALILTIRPLGTPYQGVTLTDLWGNTLEYGNRQSSLSDQQAAINSDGTYTFVIAGTDPGIANWLDTMGIKTGQIIIRIDGKRTKPLDPDNLTSLRKVRLTDVGQHIPPEMPRVSPAQREKAIAARRRHVQVRCHN